MNFFPFSRIKPLPRRLRLPLIGSSLWLMATVAGLGWFWLNENAPGRPASAPASWPQRSAIVHAAGVPELVMSAHPHCPCTRASMEELADVVSRAGGRVHVTVLFYKPAGVPDVWAHTDLWRAAEAIPGVTVRCDEEGREAARFGAGNSGCVTLYDGTGKLRYSGGITAERGHAGDNLGTDSVVAILNGATPSRTTMPTLGCSLDNLNTGLKAGQQPTLCIAKK